MTDYEIASCLVGSDMFIRDRPFHVRLVALERAPSGVAQAVVGPGHAALERLGADHVAGFLELPCVHAEVAVGRLQQVLQLVEAERLVHGERAHDREPHPLVDQPVELEGDRRPAAAHPVERRRLGDMPPLGSEIGFSHRTSGR
jgi:hypothetical protein